MPISSKTAEECENFEFYFNFTKKITNFNIRSENPESILEMKKSLLFIISVLFLFPVFGKHIIGGEMIYQYVGAGSSANMSIYRITLKLFRDENTLDGAAMPASVYIGIFDNGTKKQYPAAGAYTEVFKSREEAVSVNPFPSCITSPPNLRYNVAFYTYLIELPDNANGYTAAYQTCCRVAPLENVENAGGSNAGSTFFCEIPGKIVDSSPEFTATIDAICGKKPFKLEFGAKDPDHDSLVYFFATANDGGALRNSSNINPAPPPYNSVTYISPFSATSPLGDKATIDSKTGTISGIAPDLGRYVVTVGVSSYRNGIKLSTAYKDFIVNVTNCDFAGARLDPKPVQCDSFVVSFSNDDFSPLNKTFFWDFGDPASGPDNFSNLEKPSHKYSDTGVYVYKLVVNRGEDCSDSITQTVKVYPGFIVDFDVDGRCVNSEIYFTDKSFAKYGTINSWKWDFGVPGDQSDTSRQRNPKYTYSSEGDFPVSLTIQSTMGCEKTFTGNVTILQKPPFEITNDTLICSIDDLQLNAVGKGGTIVWSPNYNINNVNIFNPIVSPKKTTTYYAMYEESRGCNNIDSVVVSVVDFVTLRMPSDTTICLTDSIRLRPTGDALHYLWSPDATLSSATDPSPIAVPVGNTTYNVVASIGGCNTTGSVTVRTVPYPAADAGNDTTICINESVLLSGSGGSIYKWYPATYLNNDAIPSPVATPKETIQYILQVNDTRGCPKPAFDTVTIKVVTPYVDAGPRDTSIVVDQPLHLFANSNAETFQWIPSTGLNDPFSQSPTALLTNDQQYVVRAVTDGGCVATDTIMVKVFKLQPGFYVPNAFTPNNDGLNDVLTPIAIGMRSITYFRIYNRTGKLIFSTSEMNRGWNGTFKGMPQDAATFVWQAEGEDYMGNRIRQKGTSTLIR